MLRLIRPRTSCLAFEAFSRCQRSRFAQTRQKLGKHERQKFSSFSTLNSNGSRGTSSKVKWFWMPAGVGFALISFLQLRHIQDRERRKHEPSVDRVIPSWQVSLFKVVPTRVLSRLWGKVHEIELPVFLRGPVIRLWVWAFDCNLQEAEEEDVLKYANLGAFFTRKLKPGARIIDEENELVCPVDGKVLHFGRLVGGMLEQVKGVPYSLEKFLGPNSNFPHANHIETTDEKQLYHCVLYLGPGDCHHFHSPTEWSVNTRRHFPGELYSVSPWVLKGFRDVLCTNERVTLFGNWKHGAFVMSAVGAYNVGSIKIHCDEELGTNTRKGKKKSMHERQFTKESFTRGDHVGLFSMGSAIVLIFEAPEGFQFCIKPNQKVVIGQPLGTVIE